MEISEREIGKKVLDYWVSEGWDCYPECSFGGARADLVAVRNGLIAFIECKTTMSMALFDQIVDWRAYANFLYVATPSRKMKRFSRIEQHLFKYFGIGHVLVKKFGVFVSDAQYHRIRKREREVVLNVIHPDMKNYVPGSQASDGYSTPWKRTMTQAIAFIKTHPGCTVREVVAGIEHHYASNSGARACLFRWLIEDRRIRFRQEGRATNFYTVGKVKRSELGRGRVVK